MNFLNLELTSSHWDQSGSCDDQSWHSHEHSLVGVTHGENGLPFPVSILSTVNKEVWSMLIIHSSFIHTSKEIPVVRVEVIVSSIDVGVGSLLEQEAIIILLNVPSGNLLVSDRKISWVGVSVIVFLTSSGKISSLDGTLINSTLHIDVVGWWIRVGICKLNIDNSAVILVAWDHNPWFLGSRTGTSLQ